MTEKGTSFPVTECAIVAPGFREPPFPFQPVPEDFNAFDTQQSRVFYFGDVLEITDALLQSLSRGDIVEFHRALQRLDFDPSKITQYRRWGRNTLLHALPLSFSTEDEATHQLDDEFAIILATYLCRHLQMHVDIRNRRGVTPLMKAAEEGREQLIRYLVSLGADPNARDLEGKTPTIRGIESGVPHIVKVMRQVGADVTLPADDGVNPVMIALAEGNGQAATDLSGRSVTMIPKFQSPGTQNLSQSVTAAWDIGSHLLDVVSDAIVAVSLFAKGSMLEGSITVGLILLPTVVMALAPAQTVMERVLTVLQLRMPLETVRSLSKTRFTVRWGVVRFLTTVFQDVPQMAFQLYLYMTVPDDTIIVSLALSMINSFQVMHEVYYKRDAEEAGGGLQGTLAMLEPAMTVVSRSAMWGTLLLATVWFTAQQGIPYAVNAFIIAGLVLVLVLHRFHLARVHEVEVLVSDLVASMISHGPFTDSPSAYLAVQVHHFLEVAVVLILVPFLTFDDTWFSEGYFTRPSQILQVVGLSTLVLGLIMSYFAYKVISTPILGRTGQKGCSRILLGFFPILSLPHFLLAIPLGIRNSLCASRSDDSLRDFDKSAQVAAPGMGTLDEKWDMQKDAVPVASGALDPRLSIKTDSSLKNEPQIELANNSTGRHLCVYWGNSFAILVALGLAIAALVIEEYQLYLLIGAGAVYLIYLYTALKSQTAGYLKGMNELDFAYGLYVKSFQASPKITWTAEAYHEETTTKTDKNGRTTTERKKVVTHRAIHVWEPSVYWNVDSAFPRPSNEGGLLRVNFVGMSSFADQESGFWYELEQTKFIIDHDRDRQFDFSATASLGTPHDGLFFSGKTSVFMRYTYYVYSTFLLAAPLFSWWVNRNSEKQKMVVNKVMLYRVDPVFQQMLLPYVGRHGRAGVSLG